ncbi:LysR family transcriptional regulator [Sneathiella glossodoripedis]|uniref:LysR family transcriptional regulator n=1 Tax=Sneathiella glossodoripedis TaxID=418853 RepID=UPI000470AF5F|nr:LysR family transcriptional regulator [Sneathiella glossodoripedis]
MAENLTITHLKTFLMVAQLGSFRQTAEQMQTTQPAISSRIAKLEDILQTKLLDRSTGHISLTKTGQALRPHAESMVKMADRLGEYIRDNNAVTGRISLGVTEFAVHTWLPAFLENVKIVFPELTLDLQVDTSHVLKKRLLRGDLDIVFILGPVGDERIQALKSPLMIMAGMPLLMQGS